MKPLTIDSLLSGGLIVNYRCSSACAHCLYASSPRREADYIDEATARFTLSAVRDLGCRSVHIGGGEPFLDFEGLKRVLAAARDVDVGIDYVETNSSWFHDPETARRRLNELHGLGLTTLLLSISPFHNEFIPFRKVLGVMDACRECGMGIFPWIGDFAPEISSLDTNKTHSLEEYAATFGAGYVHSLPGRYGLIPGGRALETYRDAKPGRPAAAVANDRSECARLLNTTHFHVDLFGNYVPGFCTGLAIRVDDLGRSLDPAKYPVLTRLHAGGVKALLAWAEEEQGYNPLRGDGFVSGCDLCQDIRRFLVLRDDMVFPELSPSGFYEELDRC